MSHSNPQSSPSPTTETLDEILDTLIDETCTPIYEGKIVTGNLITHRFMEELKAAIDNYITQRVIEELEKAQKVKYIQYDMPVYLRNRISELKESLKGGIDE